MVQYTCRRCGYLTPIKINISKHLTRKKLCQSILEDVPQSVLLQELKAPRKDAKFTCKFCNKYFVEAKSQRNHEVKCLRKSQYVKDLEAEVKKLRDQHTKPGNSFVVNNSNDGDVNMIIININPADKPSMEHIDTEKILTLSSKKDPLERLTKHVYFDKKSPENHSIYAPSIDTNDLKMHNGKNMRKVRYPEKAIKRVVKILVNDAVNIIDKNYDKYREIIEYENELDDKKDIDQMGSE
jgi:hypothetical protein